jgi:Uncharacterized conserved protein
MIEEQKLEKYFNNLEDEEKIILYSLGVLDNMPIKNKMKLQKLLFLVSNIFENYSDLLDFEPHLYGPYSENLDDILEDLIKMRLVESEGSQYKLSPLGKQLYDRLKPKKELITVLEDFKLFLNDLTNEELLTFIYVSYPEFTSEAVKWNKLKEKRVQYAVQLLKKQKISFAKAVEISGLDAFDFELLTKKEGIKWKM